MTEKTVSPISSGNDDTSSSTTTTTAAKLEVKIDNSGDDVRNASSPDLSKQQSEKNWTAMFIPSNNGKKRMAPNGASSVVAKNGGTCGTFVKGKPIADQQYIYSCSNKNIDKTSDNYYDLFRQYR